MEFIQHWSYTKLASEQINYFFCNNKKQRQKMDNKKQHIKKILPYFCVRSLESMARFTYFDNEKAFEF